MRVILSWGLGALLFRSISAVFLVIPQTRHSCAPWGTRGFRGCLHENRDATGDCLSVSVVRSIKRGQGKLRRQRQFCRVRSPPSGQYLHPHGPISSTTDPRAGAVCYRATSLPLAPLRSRRATERAIGGPQSRRMGVFPPTAFKRPPGSGDSNPSPARHRGAAPVSASQVSSRWHGPGVSAGTAWGPRGLRGARGGTPSLPSRYSSPEVSCRPHLQTHLAESEQSNTSWQKGPP